jgi:hypothetical protein
MRRLGLLVTAVVLSALALTACGAGSSSGATGTTDLPTKRIAITFHGDSVTPNGQRYDVGVGQRIEFDVTADKPGEIHVHSSPEQEFEYDKGSSTIAVTPIRAPGVITVESHTLDKVILQLQVQ